MGTNSSSNICLSYSIPSNVSKNVEKENSSNNYYVKWGSASKTIYIYPKNFNFGNNLSKSLCSNPKKSWVAFTFNISLHIKLLHFSLIFLWIKKFKLVLWCKWWIKPTSFLFSCIVYKLMWFLIFFSLVTCDTWTWYIHILGCGVAFWLSKVLGSLLKYIFFSFTRTEGVQYMDFNFFIIYCYISSQCFLVNLFKCQKI